MGCVRAIVRCPSQSDGPRRNHASNFLTDCVCLQVAVERWVLTVDGPTLRWQVNRTFLRDVTVHDDWALSLGLDATAATNAGFEASAQM